MPGTIALSDQDGSGWIDLVSGCSDATVLIIIRLVEIAAPGGT
jgi:hypothetical protein